MGLAETCKICNENERCGCKPNLIRFFELIQRASARVSSHKPTSEELGKTPSAALIDKLIFSPLNPIPEQDIIADLKIKSIAFKKIRHRDHRWCYEIGKASRGTYLRLWSGPQPTICEIVTRPSAFSTFQAYLEHLQTFLPPKQISTAAIKRLDLAIDYKLNFETVLRGFDFKQKQLQAQFLDKGSNRTGLRIGKGSEVIQVYDKAIESGLKEPTTRIEFQLKGKKLPAKKISELQLRLENQSNLFSIIALNDVTTASPQTINEQQQKRRNELESLLAREGYYSARRFLNQNGNFIRDYGPILKIAPWLEQPDESFRRMISNYFNPNQGGTNGTH